MSTPLGSARNGHGSIATCFFCTLLATLFLPITASAGDPENTTGTVADSEGLPRSPSQRQANPSEIAPRWTVSVGAIVLGRTGGVDRTLAGLLPGSTKFDSTAFSSGAEVFNSNQFRPGLSAGPKIDLTYRGDSGYGVELSYFNIFNQSATKAIGPTNPLDWLVMKAPGTFWQTQDFPYQAMVWKATTNVYSAEANGRLDLSSRVTMLAGFRWLRLNDNLQGMLTPSDRSDPTWKTPPNDYTLLDLVTLPPMGSGGTYPPFWTTSTTNNLYGVQVGLDGKIWELGRLSLDGQVKVGVFDNDAEQSTGVSLEKTVYPATATANHAAFASEASLQLKYQLTNGLALKASYEVLWLDGVALAPGQIQETYTAPTTPPNVRALGVNCRSNVLFQGATFGLEYSF